MSKLAMIKIGQNKELKELGFRMIFPVHDILCKLVVFKLIERKQKRCANKIICANGQPNGNIKVVREPKSFKRIW